MRIVKKQVESAGDFSANYTSDVIETRRMAFGIFQIDWSGATTGTLHLEVTANKDAASPIWTSIDTQATGGAAGSHAFNVTALTGEAYRIRLVYTSGGASTATIDIFLKAESV